MLDLFQMSPKMFACLKIHKFTFHLYVQESQHVNLAAEWHLGILVCNEFCLQHFKILEMYRF